MFNRNLWLRFIGRVLLEFGPPTAFVIYATYPNITLASFSTTLAGAGLFWAGLLRIQYQQTNRYVQDKTAERVGQVQENLDDVKAMLAEVMPILGHTNLSPEEIRKVSKVVRQANTTIETANTVLDTFQRKSMNFKFGPFSYSSETRTKPSRRKVASGDYNAV